MIEKGTILAKRDPNLRRIGLALALGVVAGAGVRYYINTRVRNAPQTRPALIDWAQAREVALRVSEWEQAPVRDRAHRDAQYVEMVRRSEPLIAAYLGADLPAPVNQIAVVDRREWLEANFASFEKLFGFIEELYDERSPNPTLLTNMIIGLNGRANGAVIGALLGYMARRVLGQYDLSLLSPDPEARGALLFVEPNISRIQTQLGVSDEDFRLWIALHETTHVFEFEAYPWVREHFNGLLRRYFAQLSDQLSSLGEGLFQLIERIRRDPTGHWFQQMLTAEQRQLFDEIQALMSIVEGYGNHVMNAVGAELLPSFHEIEQRMASRERSRSLIDQLIMRVTGLDLKMAQYQLGEAFIKEVVEARGIEFANRVWERAENLPTMDEIREPHRWIARLER